MFLGPPHEFATGVNLHLSPFPSPEQSIAEQNRTEKKITEDQSRRTEQQNRAEEQNTRTEKEKTQQRRTTRKK